MTSSDESKQAAIETTREELKQFPAPVLESYEEALEKLSGRLADETCQQWAIEGLEIARKTVRSWEAAAEFFDASIAVQRQLPSGQFLKWAKTGTSLCEDSPSLAVAYFKSSPKAMLRLRPRYIDDWANVCRALYRGTWKSSALACRLFEATPDLLETLSFEEFCHFGEFLEILSRRSYDQAGDALGAGIDLFPKITGDVDRFINLAQIVAEKSWRETAVLFDSATASLIEINNSHRAPLISLARRLVITGVSDAAGVLRDGANTVNRVPSDSRDRLLEMTDAIAAVSAPAAPEFLKIVPEILERVTFEQMGQWQSEGVQAARESDEAAISYFKLESPRSQEMLDSLSSSIELSRVREIIQMYCLALTGHQIDVQAAAALAEKNIGWFQGELPTTEGTTIYMPSVINRYTSKEENFGFFKVISTHQIGHIEFGSFAFDFNIPSLLFDDLRSRLPGATELKAAKAADELAKKKATEEPQVVVFGHEPPPEVANATPEPAAEVTPTEFLTDMSRFFDLFIERRLALDIFTVLESSRIDGYVEELYPGVMNEVEIARAMRHVGLGIDQGGLGIGLLLDYLDTAVSEGELEALFTTAADRRAPLFIHIRRGIAGDPSGLIEVIELAKHTGASIHICHLSASAMGGIDNFLELVEEALVEGVDISAESYPYNAGSTSIGADVFNRDWKSIFGITYSDVQLAETGEFFTKARWNEVRAEDPGATIIHHYGREDWTQRAMVSPAMMIGSDAMPIFSKEIKSHPRAIGTFSRVLAEYVRGSKILSLSEALSKMSYLPAKRLEGIAPKFKRKGRIQPGADADIVIFDIDSIRDRATYDQPYSPSTGIMSVIVNGQLVVNQGIIVPNVFPGRIVMGS